MRIGISYTPEHRSPEEWAQTLVRKNYRAVTFPVDFTADINTIDAYVKAAAENDIQIAEVGIWTSPHHPDPVQAKQAYERCLEQLRLAEYVQARCCVNVSGAAGELWFGCYKANYDPDLYKRNVDLVRKLLDAVDPRYTCFTLEPMQWMAPSSVEEYQRLLRDVNHPAFKVHMDICNLISTPYLYTHQEALMDEAFEILGSQIMSCHIKDLLQKPGISVSIDEVPIGTGAVNLGHYLDLIDTLDPDTPVLIEHLRTMEDYDAARQTIRERFGR